MYKLNLVYYKHSHHSNHSGYHRILEFLPNTELKKINIQRKIRLPYKISTPLIENTKVKWYNENSLHNELGLFIKSINLKKEIIHYIYGDDSFFYLGFFPKLKSKKIVCTFHHPPEYFNQFVLKKSQLKRLDSVFVVGKNQIDYFKKLVGHNNIFFTPHGIDTDFFKPSNEPKDFSTKNCIFAGNWLRDFEMCAKTIDLINKKRNDISFTIVTFEKNFKYFEGLKNTKLLRSIGEEQLLQLYQKASLMLLPLIDCTANNAILEGIACGLPIVTTNVGASKDYINEKCAFLIDSKDYINMADKTIELLDDRKLLQEFGNNARIQALNFSWDKVAAQMVEIFNKITN